MYDNQLTEKWEAMRTVQRTKQMCFGVFAILSRHSVYTVKKARRHKDDAIWISLHILFMEKSIRHTENGKIKLLWWCSLRSFKCYFNINFKFSMRKSHHKWCWCACSHQWFNGNGKNNNKMSHVVQCAMCMFVDSGLCLLMRKFSMFVEKLNKIICSKDRHWVHHHFDFISVYVQTCKMCYICSASKS